MEEIFQYENINGILQEKEKRYLKYKIYKMLRCAFSVPKWGTYLKTAREHEKLRFWREKFRKSYKELTLLLHLYHPASLYAL